MRRVLFTLLVSLGILLFANAAMAGAVLPIGSDASLNLGYRVQALMIATDADLVDDDGEWESYREWNVRRARFRLGAKVGDHVTAFLQTDAAAKDVVLIDAWVAYKVSPWLQFIVGRNMAPANRQNLTSSGALMAIDRPGVAYKSLTWGGRAVNRFANSTFNESDSGLRSPDSVRDNGLTIFGSNTVGSNGNLKYYAGIYNGIQDGTTNDEDRFTFRAQYNLWDAEAAYFQSSTYLGTKKTLGIGVSYDMQKEVGASDPADPQVDYTYLSADVFLEYPIGSGCNALTAEFGYSDLDFNNNPGYMNSQGSGFYGQAGFFICSVAGQRGWQPWVEYESFDSDATANANGEVMGTYTNFRVGVTYYLEGQHANIKLGYESFSSDTMLITDPADATKGEDTINTITLGFYTTY